MNEEKIQHIENKFWGMIVEETGGSVCVLSEDAKALREIISGYTYLG